MAQNDNSQTATKATTNNFFASPSKQFNGKCLVRDGMDALYFLQRHVTHLVRCVGRTSWPSEMMNSPATRDAFETFKTDTMRLIPSPLFWLLMVLAGISSAAAFIAALLWVVCSPLLLRNCDFLTWALRENSEKFKGKVAWVTGGSSGIGLALSKDLSVRGVKGLILTGRSLSRLETAREEIVSFAHSRGVSFSKEDVLLLPLDLSRGLRPEKGGEEAAAAEAWERTVQQAIHWRGGVDFLFNNAGRLAVGCLPLTETIAELMDVNFLSVVKLTNMLLPHMRARDSGHIVFTNSSSAYFNFGGFNAYATSKVALLSYANLLRQDLRGCGSRRVLVTSVHPGYVKTHIHQNISDPLVDPSCKRDVSVEWNQQGLDVNLVSSFILRAVSRDSEEAWMAGLAGLLQMYLGFYLPLFIRFARRFTAKKECELTTEYRETIVSQLTNSHSRDTRK